MTETAEPERELTTEQPDRSDESGVVDDDSMYQETLQREVDEIDNLVDLLLSSSPSDQESWERAQTAVSSAAGEVFAHCMTVGSREIVVDSRGTPMPVGEWAQDFIAQVDGLVPSSSLRNLKSAISICNS